MGEGAYLVLGEPRPGGVLVVADHASNRVPADIELGIDPALLDEHVAVDIGVAGVARRMVERAGVAAFPASTGPITRRWPNCSTARRRC